MYPHGQASSVRVDEISHPTIRIRGELFLLESVQRCWRCKKSQSVVGLAATELDDADTGEADPNDGPFLLSVISVMPAELLATITAAFPHYQPAFLNTDGFVYHANHCACGAQLADHFLFSEPGGAFFPDDEKVAARILIRPLRTSLPMDLRCSWSAGSGDFLFKNGTRQH